ncbi:MAG TPA: alkaline phosphatase family protein [Candidatus Baltobacteraceae bacterium]|nr:alkaline phosphatase family protein [Candidatus Baltobacteraceae bacterium]
MKRFLAIATLISLAACGGGSPAGGGNGMLPVPGAPGSPGKIKHIVILVQENRSFDDLFATFQGADGTTKGKLKTGAIIPLKKVPLYSPTFPSYVHSDFVTDFDHGNMDGFAVPPNGTYVYQYVDPAQIKPYWTLAKQYVLADHMFMTQGSASFTAHQDLIRGGSRLDANRTLVDVPSDGSGGAWGCDAPAGTYTFFLTNAGQEESTGPFPCFGKTYTTLRDTLDAKNVSWKYYVPGKINSNFDANIWNAFDSIKAVRRGAEWGTKVVWPSTTLVFNDISKGQLPAVSWVIPDACNSDHPGNFSSECGGAHDTGPSWVASIVNAIGKSKYWDSTAIVVVWDDWGGFYDHVPPPQTGSQAQVGGPGFRVPMIVVSAYAKQGVVSHQVYGFGSIVRFVEDTFGLASLNTTDAISRDFAIDAFNFNQKPRTFTPITAKYSQSFFEHQAPSGLPVDTE